ncbi:MAG TPA: DNA ligase D [Rudaea sp.]|jgi:bifunctional non-homologous end joining protein LigD|nr:DNA ligase D [Rudaea sp.]
MALREYSRKRNFKNTPEPSSGGARGKELIFVVQLHHASHRHYDFRLEWNGTLKSWAVPKGPSFDPKVKRLAMEVEDHPISYATFEGDIPKGNYGAGHVDVFDHGTWEPEGSAREGLAKGDLKFTLHGDVLRGSWVLVRTRRQGTKNQWLLIKHADGYSGPREADDFLDTAKDRPLPPAQRKKVWPKPTARAKPNRTDESAGEKETITGEAFAPELCRTLSTPPAGDDWLHEVKWDGYRMLATVAKGKARLWSRNAIEWTHKLPELVKAIQSLKLKSAQLDGEMIVLRDGRDDFNALQGRLSAENQDPAMLILFDMPHLNGYSLRNLPLITRKGLLEMLLEEHDHPLLRFSAHQIGNGDAVFKEAVSAKREGIVSKRVNSSYHGTRNGDWVKVKARPSDEFVVIGFTEPKGSRSGIGALLLAKPQGSKLVYAGRVGTGFDDEMLRDLRKRLLRIETRKTDVDISILPAKDRYGAHWVKPKMVIEVFHQGIGGQGLLRQPAFKTIRVDKSIDDLGESPRAKKAGTNTPVGKRAVRKTATKKAAAKTSAPLKVSHAERTVYGEAGITKGDVAGYYAAIAPWMLPEIADRPLSVLRCPNGVGRQCFVQKHVKPGIGDHVYPVRIREEGETRDYLSVRDEQGLLELVQMNVLEFHPWGAKADDVEHCDRVVFDLDPHPTVEWKRVIAAARDMKKQLESIGLQSFVRTSGGKGLHVVVPLDPPCTWENVRDFTQSVAQAMSALRPREYVAVAGERNRQGKIFIDWLRNGRGATSVGSYSLRARERAGVAMPLAWTELGRIRSGDQYTFANALERVTSKPDPWKSIARVRQSLPDL